jgi:hypothetical protein
VIAVLLRCLAAVLIVLMLPGIALAQAPAPATVPDSGVHRPGWPRIYVSIDSTLRAIYQPDLQTLTYEEFAENAAFTATFNEKRTPTYGATVGARIWGALGAGVTVTRVQTRNAATVEADIPHPFFFDQFRHLSGEIGQTTRDELAVHGQVRIYIPIRSKFDVVLFGGPSRWQVRQTVLDRVSYTQTYPYDTAEFVGADVTDKQVTAWGYNGGVDVSVYFTHNIGVGSLVEIATANLPLQRPDGTTADANVGGLRGGAGLRLRF